MAPSFPSQTQQHWLLFQNETSCVGDGIRLARQKSPRSVIILNPAPISTDVAGLGLDCVDVLVVNEGEAAALCVAVDVAQNIENADDGGDLTTTTSTTTSSSLSSSIAPMDALYACLRRFPNLKLVVITLGGSGVVI